MPPPGMLQCCCRRDPGDILSTSLLFYGSRLSVWSIESAFCDVRHHVSAGFDGHPSDKLLSLLVHIISV